MLSTSMSPYLDVELAYRLERLGAHVPHEPLAPRRAARRPFGRRAERQPARRHAAAH